MPKIVDHDARRAEIVRATWRIIARHGFESATMREIAAEAGYANGALKPYFATKNDLLRATYQFVFEQTNDRASAAHDDESGLDALTRFCREVLPLDATRIDEARVVVAFWGAAENIPAAQDQHITSMGMWREWLIDWLTQIDPSRDQTAGADVLLQFLLGAQITAALNPNRATAEGYEAQLATLLEGLVGVRPSD